jgi:hypothetical protein
VDGIHISFNCNQLDSTAEHKKRLHNPAEHALGGFKSRPRHQIVGP